MHVDVAVLCLGFLAILYGAAIGFSPRAAAYINKISLDKRWLPPHLAKYSIKYVDGAFALGLGAALIFAAFIR
jgi:hypothetical protein